jgi:hypothetical protein
MDTQTKQELEALRIALENFIYAAEYDPQISDEKYSLLKHLSEKYQKDILQTLRMK